MRGVLAPGVLLTLIIFKLNRAPEPESGTKLFWNPETRRVLIGPAPSTFAFRFQSGEVNAVAETGELWKLMIVESKVKSPWNPIRLSEASMLVVLTG